MESTLKCPFCETELEQGIKLLRGGHILGCPKCKRNADDIFWFALIKAKQDLEIAKSGLNRVITKTNSQVVRGFEYIATGIVKVAKDTLKQIEHKE